jgi:carboxymethylenebutenolidase
VTTGEKLEIQTPDGKADAWVHRPAGGGAAPGIVMFPDAFSVRPAAHEMAHRLAGLGYCVLLPNVFYRAGDFAPFDARTVWGDPTERARLGAIMQQLDRAASMRDAAAYFDALAAHTGAKPGPFGAIGYCMGGRIAFTAAGAFPDRVAAVACIHGGHIVTPAPDSPHATAGVIKAQLYFGVSDNDGSCTPEHQAELAKALGAAHVAYQIELYKGAGHGFAVPDMPVFDAGHAERHWKRVAALFAEVFPRD